MSTPSFAIANRGDAAELPKRQDDLPPPFGGFLLVFVATGLRGDYL